MEPGAARHAPDVFITGEAGIGKTTLVEAFLAQLMPATPCWVGRGQCIEHYGGGEAYLPLLDTLGRLGRGPAGARLVLPAPGMPRPGWRSCRRSADPTTGGAAADGAGARPGRACCGSSWTRWRADHRQPLVLVLEDLHWSDASTVEVLALLARRRETARLLVLGTYRSVEVIVYAHPLKAVKQELVAQGRRPNCRWGAWAWRHCHIWPSGRS